MENNKQKTKMFNITLNRDLIFYDWGLPWDSSDNAEIIEDKILDNTRWSIIHSLVVKIGDKFYKTKYSVGATESQDESPWQDDEEVVFTEVKPVEKTIIVYEKVVE